MREDISVPTCFIILPYKLCRNSLGHLEAPQNITSLAIGEKNWKTFIRHQYSDCKAIFLAKNESFHIRREWNRVQS